jgi:copper(I)-binding protein/cytochrome oxidase Cu insertion factor (SCO1/SenC/PrrC family)
MRNHILSAAIAVMLWPGISVFAAGSPWGANYFPNVPLTTQDGETVSFFDDVIKDKVVAINFIYTSCVDTCPLETAQLAKVQQILGDRMGDDIFFYSISIDPEHDTPPVLKEYAERFGARWTFLTGKEADIILLRRKLGLYIEEIQDGSRNHNVSMIIGNQATGRWMKRSPFENPYVLANQLGSWLSGWKNPPTGKDYANAPKLRSISDGEQLFRTRCAICHSIDGRNADDLAGPDLLGVTAKRDPNWLANWLRAPDQMLAKKDPIAMALYEQYGGLVMPNLRLSKVDVTALLEYMGGESRRLQDNPRPRPSDTGDVVAIANAWIRESDPGATANAGYMTLVNIGSEAVTLVGVESAAFEKIEMHEMVTVNDLPRMHEVTPQPVPPGGQAQFSPGGKHMMMMGPRQPLTAGQQVDMTLIFDSGKAQSVSARVAERAP